MDIRNPLRCLLLFAIEAGDFLDLLNQKPPATLIDIRNIGICSEAARRFLFFKSKAGYEQEQIIQIGSFSFCGSG